MSHLRRTAAPKLASQRYTDHRSTRPPSRPTHERLRSSKSGGWLCSRNIHNRPREPRAKVPRFCVTTTTRSLFSHRIPKSRFQDFASPPMPSARSSHPKFPIFTSALPAFPTTYDRQHALPERTQSQIRTPADHQQLASPSATFETRHLCYRSNVLVRWR